MSRFRLRMIASTIAALALASSYATSAEVGVSDTEITIGTTNALSGGIAATCSPVTTGMGAWFKKVNADGGVNGRKIAFTVLDDAYSPERAIANARRLVDNQRVFALVGGCATATSAAMLPFMAQRADVPYLYPYAFMSELYEPLKRNVFALPPIYSDQMTAIVPFVLDRMKEPAKTGAIVSMNVPGVDQWRATVAGIYKSRGIDLVVDDVFDITAPDKSNLVAQLKSRNPDILVIVDSGIGAARLFLEMARQGWRPRAATGSSSLNQEAFISAAGKEADGILTVPGIMVTPADPRAKACNDSLAQHASGTVQTDPSLFGCLGAQVFVEAVKRLGKDVTRAGLIQALEQMRDFDPGISAPVGFRPDSHLGLRAVFPVTVEGGQFKILGDPLPIR